ncbi:hypothetical protein AMTR_s00128p00118780 [Amborella trichopoda]|uniref:Uncharacterized protein n=1 Tax=Amborella trichopoda TaxID=13333 RepID=W1NMS5_AMBTC|nr:hypothetical protein AMTR_s00128p00118780 [Amborella trichopoda]
MDWFSVMGHSLVTMRLHVAPSPAVSLLKKLLLKVAREFFRITIVVENSAPQVNSLPSNYQASSDDSSGSSKSLLDSRNAG